MDTKEFSRTLERRIEKIEEDISEIKNILHEHKVFVNQSPKPEKHYEHHAFVDKTMERIEMVYKSFFKELGRLIFMLFLIGILYWILHANSEGSLHIFGGLK